MFDGMNKLMTMLVLFAWVIPGVSTQIRAEEGDYLTVSIPSLVEDAP